MKHKNRIDTCLVHSINICCVSWKKFEYNRKLKQFSWDQADVNDEKRSMIPVIPVLSQFLGLAVPEQLVQIQIKLLQKEQFDQDLHCLTFSEHCPR